MTDFSLLLLLVPACLGTHLSESFRRGFDDGVRRELEDLETHLALVREPFRVGAIFERIEPRLCECASLGGAV